MDPDEPVFKKTKWGPNRYVANPRNPIGLTLILLILAYGAVMMLMTTNGVGPFAPSSHEPDPVPSYTLDPADIAPPIPADPEPATPGEVGPTDAP